ncbi:MAG TPA: Rrf2 family transcriptional regulator [Crinalium sp.]
MELSSRVEYALLALLELASHHARKEPLKISEITAHQAMPDRYLEQILTNLRRSGLVQSHRGAKGGYVLAREPWQITLLDIVSSVEGDSHPKETDGSTQPTIEKNVVDEVWQQARNAAQSILSHYTLQDLCQRRDAYRQTNPMYYI